MRRKQSWMEKLNAPRPHEVKPCPTDIDGMKAGQIMLIPSARIVDDFVRTIPKGTSLDVKTLRHKLARKYRAEVTCPITLGFHLRTVAEAAYEAFADGTPMRDVTPIWRVLDADAPTTKKLSYDPSFLLEQRRREKL